jgi:hypothetical protein
MEEREQADEYLENTLAVRREDSERYETFAWNSFIDNESQDSAVNYNLYL